MKTGMNEDKKEVREAISDESLEQVSGGAVGSAHAMDDTFEFNINEAENDYDMGDGLKNSANSSGVNGFRILR